MAPIVAITLLDLLMLILGIADWRWAFSTEKSVIGLIVEYAVFSGVFVFAGVFTAPSGKRIVAVLLGSLSYLYLITQIIIVLFYPGMITSKLPVIYGIAGAIAASLAVRAVFKDESFSFLRGSKN